MDHISPLARSANMCAVKQSNTLPEVRVRRVARALGLRFQLRRRDLAQIHNRIFGTQRRK